MRKIILLACCAALVGSISVASARNTGPVSQETMKTHDPMNANAKMKKKHKHKKSMMKSDDSMKGGMSKDGMSKDGMKKDPMSK
jgi:pentapeptide MXKDX repeat protein